MADKVVAALVAPFDIGGRHLQIGGSVGVAFGVEPQAGWNELIRRADRALCRAKASGRGRHSR